jgi:hypothetical protein
MHRQDEKAIGCGHLEEPRPEKRAGAELEGTGGFLSGQSAELGLSIEFPGAAHPYDREVERRLGRDALYRFPLDIGKGCPQDLVAAHDFGEGPRQRIEVERTEEPHRSSDVIRGVPGFKLLEKPQTFLAKSQRVGIRIGAPSDTRSRTVVPALLQKTALEEGPLLGRKP